MRRAHQIETAADPEQFVIAAELYERMSTAAAKLAVAVGVPPSEAQRSSGIQRVEIKRAASSVRRQTIELDRAAVLLGESIPRHLVHPDEVLSERGATLADDYLKIASHAQRRQRRELYLKAVDDHNRDFNKVSNDFSTAKEQFTLLMVEYDALHSKMNQIAVSTYGAAIPAAALLRDHGRRISWRKRDQIVRELRPIIKQRDSIRVRLSEVSRRLQKVMARYQRHQARRAYFRSSSIDEYGDYRSLFIPRATFYDMEKFDFNGALRRRPSEISKSLELSARWNQVRIEFASEREKLLASLGRDELSDHLQLTLIEPQPASFETRDAAEPHSARG
jgi:hypothetical protein